MDGRRIESITVQDILDVAHVSRGTFYKYFWDKYDLANAYYAEYVQEHILPRYDGTNWRSLLVEIMYFIRKNKDYFCQLTGLTIHGFAEFLLEAGEKGYRQNYLINTGKDKLDRRDRYALEFYNSGCVRLICLWLEDGCVDSPEDIADLVLDLLPAEYHSVDDIAPSASSDSYLIVTKDR